MRHTTTLTMLSLLSIVFFTLQFGELNLEQPQGFNQKRLPEAQMKMIRLEPAVAAFLMLSAPAVNAQQSDVAKIERVAAAYSAAHFLEGAIAFDPTPTVRPHGSSQRSPDEARILATAFRATRVGDRNRYYACAGNSPSSCRVSGADVVVSMTRPEISGDTAFIVVRTLRPTRSSRSPVVREEIRLRVQKRNGAWLVTGHATESIT